MHPTLLSPASRPSTSKTASQQDTSRSFMTASMTSTNKYPKCEYKKQHNKQLLNLICLTDNCKTRGAICAMCKTSQHATHMVIPIKKFLGNVHDCIKAKLTSQVSQFDIGKKEQQKKQGQKQKLIMILDENNSSAQQNLPKQQQPSKPIQKDESQKKISQIISQKQKMLYYLSKYVNNLAQKIMKIQQKIINDAQFALQSAKNAANMEINLKKLVNQLEQQKQGEEINAQIYRAKVRNLLQMVKCKTKLSCEMNSQGINKICQNFINNGQSFVLNLQNWAQQSQKNLQKIFEHNPNAKKYGQQKDKQKQKQKKPSNLADLYRFSSDLKIKSITLSNQNKIAKQTEKLPGIVLMTGPSLKQKKFSLKILSMSSSIMVGVGFKDIIKQNQYKINSSNPGHGTYMIGHNSYTYSHHSKAHNMVMKGIAFGTGQQLQIFIKGDVINFCKKSDPKTITLPLKKMTQQDWKQLSICVYLGGVGDKVQILQ